MILAGARPAAVLAACLTTLAALATPAWSEPGPRLAIARVGAVVDSAPRAEYAGPAYAEEPVMPAPAGPDLPLTTSVADREPTDLRLLLTGGERWRLMEVGAAMTWHPLSATITAFGQLPYVVTEPGHVAPAFDDTHAPAALGVTGQAGGFEAGVQYRSAGKRLERLIGAPAALKDREGHEVWVAQRLGVVRLRLADSTLTDNVDRNPALARTTKDQTAVTAELGVSEWPVLGLTFASGESARVRLTPEGRETAAEHHEFDSVTGSAYYHGGPRWDVTASSTVSRARHVVRPADDMTALSQDLALTLHPLESVTLNPTLSLVQERHAWADLVIDSRTAGLTLSYAPVARGWSVSSFVSYTATSASDDSTDGRSVSLGGALRCALGPWLPGSTVSFEAGYDRYVDAAIPHSGSGAVAGFVLLKLAAF